MSLFGKLVIALFLLLAPTPLWAAATPWQHDEDIAVRLLAAQGDADGKAPLLLALDMQLADGWHTYWRSPGDAGLPPALDWSGSQNLKTTQLLYPLPERIDENGLQTLGYRGRVVLPMHAQPMQNGQALHLKLKADILLCKEICVPKNFTFTLALPHGFQTSAGESKLIAEALARVPTPAEQAGVTITDITVAGGHLSLTAQAPDKINAPDLILETADGTAIAPSSIALGLGGNTVTFRVRLTSEMAEKTAGEGLPLTATLIDGSRAVEVPIKAASTTPAALKLVGFMLLALIGGFILNLMPCVLPVLSLKVLGLVRHGGKGADEHHLVRHSFLATAGGVVFSFLVLALITILLKFSGQTLGWGVQFQQPAFLVFLIGILTLFACNLLGFFEITLPRFLMDAVDPVHHPKLAGDFATGALATLLATPCTAPFLGTAVAFALTAGALEIMAIFFALGTGMATPYLLIAARPSLATRLPKPGVWMVVLTRLLGLGLASTALWLLYVLHAEIGRHAALLVGALMLLLAFTLYLRHARGRKPWILPTAGLVLLAALVTAHITATPLSVRQSDSEWVPYNQSELERHLREGKTVYVDVTADWCLTCKVNKRLTLSRPDIRDLLFHSAGLVAMRADWTNPDPRITNLLRKHNRFGIPFTVVYGPRAPEGLVLPELLFADDIFEAVDQARPTPKTCPSDLPVGMGC